MSNRKLSKLERWLLSASALGFTIYHGDGHRWINFLLNEQYEYFTGTDKCNIRSKCYGGVCEALMRINRTLKDMCGKGLNDVYIGDIEYSVFDCGDEKPIRTAKRNGATHDI